MPFNQKEYDLTFEIIKSSKEGSIDRALLKQVNEISGLQIIAKNQSYSMLISLIEKASVFTFILAGPSGSIEAIINANTKMSAEEKELAKKFYLDKCHCLDKMLQERPDEFIRYAKNHFHEDDVNKGIIYKWIELLNKAYEISKTNNGKANDQILALLGRIDYMKGVRAPDNLVSVKWKRRAFEFISKIKNIQNLDVKSNLNIGLALTAHDVSSENNMEMNFFLSGRRPVAMSGLTDYNTLLISGLYHLKAAADHQESIIDRDEKQVDCYVESKDVLEEEKRDKVHAGLVLMGLIYSADKLAKADKSKTEVDNQFREKILQLETRSEHLKKTDWKNVITQFDHLLEVKMDSKAWVAIKKIASLKVECEIAELGSVEQSQFINSMKEMLRSELLRVKPKLSLFSCVCLSREVDSYQKWLQDTLKVMDQVVEKIHVVEREKGVSHLRMVFGNKLVTAMPK